MNRHRSRIAPVAVVATAIALSSVLAAIALSTIGTSSTRVAPAATKTAGLPAAAARQADPERVTCVTALRAGAYAVEGSVKAARAWLRPRTMHVQGSTYRLTPDNYTIWRVAPISLDAAKGTDERRLAKLVHDQCGRPMDEQTWMVIVLFPRSTLAVGAYAMLMTRTSEGWRVVYVGKSGG
jgi:hypothetical protein